MKMELSTLSHLNGRIATLELENQIFRILHKILQD